MNHPPTWPVKIDDPHVCDNRDDVTDFICEHPSHDHDGHRADREYLGAAIAPIAVDWAQPADLNTPLGNALRAIAIDIDAGAPAPFAIVFSPGVLAMQVTGDGDDPAAAVREWAKILGVTTVKIEHHWGSSGDKYTVEGFLTQGYRLRVWDAWPAPGVHGGTVEHVPVSLLEPLAFDDPPAIAPTGEAPPAIGIGGGLH